MLETTVVRFVNTVILQHPNALNAKVFGDNAPISVPPLSSLECLY